MRRIVLVLAVLMLVSPAWARLDIDCTANGKVVTVSWNATSEPNKVRAFALDIIADSGAKITEVNDVNADYYVHPGSYTYDENGVHGSAVCDGNYPGPGYPGTGPGLDSNWVTVEMGSLYYPTGDNSPNAPASSGVLLTFTVDNTCTVIIRENTIRAGCVLTSGAEVQGGDFNSPGITIGGPNSGTCWDALECAGQATGDATCDSKVNLDDLTALKRAWGKTVGSAHGQGIGEYNCCTDFTQDGKINLDDLTELKRGWGVTGHSPSTAEQSCPAGY